MLTLELGTLGKVAKVRGQGHDKGIWGYSGGFRRVLCISTQLKSWNFTEQHSRTPPKNTRVLICHNGLRCIVMKLCKLFLLINPIFSSLLDISDHSCVHFSACYRKAWKQVTLLLVKPAWENLRSKFMFQLDERKLPQFDCKTMTLTWHVKHLELAYNIWSNLGNELWWE